MLDRHNLSSHQQRIITGALIAVPLFAVIAAGPFWSWCILVALITGIGLWEVQGLLFEEKLSSNWMVFFIAVGLLPPAGAVLGGASGLNAGMAAAIFIGFCSMLAFDPLNSGGLARTARFTLGWFYISYLLSHVLLIGQGHNARAWLFLVVAVTVPNDTGAYLTGRRWGKHKLYELVSPKKTLEGSLGGMVAGILIGTLFGILFLDVSSLPLILLCALLGVIGQIGDLIESMIKRIHGIKDSSNLLPGHGGILDRLDSLLFCFPVVWFFSVSIG